MRRKRTSPVKPIKAQLNALEKLKRLDLSLHVIWSRRGIPSHLCGILSVEIEKDPEEAARKFLLKNRKLFKMKEGLQDLTLIRKVNSLGGSHVIEEWHVYLDKKGNILDILDALLSAAGRARIVISIYDQKNILVKKLVKRTNNMKVGTQKSIERSWRIPKRLKTGDYNNTVSAYYNRKKIGIDAGEFMVMK